MPWILLGFFLGYVVSKVVSKDVKTETSLPEGMNYSYLAFDNSNKLLGTYQDKERALEEIRKVKGGVVKRVVIG